MLTPLFCFAVLIISVFLNLSTPIFEKVQLLCCMLRESKKKIFYCLLLLNYML
nr:MAG TPA: hypothetical protein [Caudoviricetes sp.]